MPNTLILDPRLVDTSEAVAQRFHTSYRSSGIDLNTAHHKATMCSRYR